MKMGKKIIGIASNFEVLDNTEKLTLNYTYSKALEKVGATPLIIPMTKDLDLVKRLIELCSGLLIPGGSDISPLKFGQEPMKGMGEAKPDLDDFQLMITRYSLSIGLTFLGICRGAQVLNVALGGTLIQDLDHIDGPIQHRQSARKRYASHTVRSEPDSIIGRVLGESFCVNSFHHQAIDKPGRDLRITSRAKDGVVESIEHVDNTFVVGVQWHPEAMLEEDDQMLPLFEEFVEKSSNI